MNEEPLGRVLSRCLDRIAAGETVAACLAQYPQHAERLAPLLAVAAEMGALGSYRISDAGRQRMRAQVLNAEVIRNEQRAAHWWRWPAAALAMPRLAMGLTVAVLCVILSTAVVAASEPGDLAYGARIALERMPALLARGPENRTRAELGIVDRRLADLDRMRQSQRVVVDERVVAALLDSVERAATLAATLPDAERADFAGRLLEQAGRLARLGEMETTEGERTVLEASAVTVRRAAERVYLRPPAGRSPAGPPTATAVAVPSATPMPDSQPPGRSVLTAQPTRGVVVTRTPRPTHSPTPPVLGSGSNATPQGPNPKVTRQGPGPIATAAKPWRKRDPAGPWPNGYVTRCWSERHASRARRQRHATGSWSERHASRARRQCHATGSWSECDAARVRTKCHATRSWSQRNTARVRTKCHTAGPRAYRYASGSWSWQHTGWPSPLNRHSA